MSNNFHDFEWATDELKRARNKDNGRKVQNNTRLFQRSDDKIAVKLHAVDIVTINRDGTYTLRAEGWHTVTTLDRIRSYSPAKLFSERGDWFLRLEPDPADPAPDRVRRTVPKPFDAFDPGPEPVKNDEGCVAGQLVTTEHVDEVVEIWRSDMRHDDDDIIEIVRESGTGNSDYDKVKVKRTWDSYVWVGERAQSYQDEGWGQHSVINGERATYVQCSHCKDFDTRYAIWREAMHGSYWGRRFDQPSGYATYRKMLDQFGSMQAWQEAYLTDLRARRAYLKADREWEQRNRVLFYDGITVDSNGYAPRERKAGPSKATLAKHERKVAKLKQQIDNYVNDYIAKLKQGMPMPGGGDCWYCLMRTNVGAAGEHVETGTGKTWGDLSNHDHLFQHMKERYYVPSLAVNALRERGYKDVGIMLWLDMNPEAGTMGGRGKYDNVRRDIRKYMMSRMLPQAPTK